jgi:hypothetical protein
MKGLSVALLSLTFAGWPIAQEKKPEVLNLANTSADPRSRLNCPTQ